MSKSAAAGFIIIALSLLVAGCDALSPASPSSINDADGNNGQTTNLVTGAKNAAKDILKADAPIPINGVEMTNLHGWFAGIYPWAFLPEQTPLNPISDLFTPHQEQTASQVSYQNDLLNQYGSAADVLSFNPDPMSTDYSHWQATYFTNGNRPFFLLWEHMDSGFIPREGPKDMSNNFNRKVFMDNLDFMFNNVIRPYQNRYVTISGRAVIYLWASGAMTGDFAGLVEQAKHKYPVAFIGSNEDLSNVSRVSVFDGLMDYSVAGFGGDSGDYQAMVINYQSHLASSGVALDVIKRQTRKQIYSIPTFQFAYDDTLVVPRRGNNPVYAKSCSEVAEHARLIKISMTRWRNASNLGPFVVFDELPEAAAVIPTVPLPEKAGRCVGYGTARIDTVRRFFGGQR